MSDILDTLNNLIVSANRRGEFRVSPSDFQRIWDDICTNYAALSEKTGQSIKPNRPSPLSIPYGSLEIVSDPSVAESLYAR